MKPYRRMPAGIHLRRQRIGSIDVGVTTAVGCRHMANIDGC
jgi:hypothetical protein